MNPISFDAAYDIQRSRLTTFFRLFIVIPWVIWASIYGIAALVVVTVAWFAMLFTGRYPEGMYNFVARYLRLLTRVYAYALLFTDELPPRSTPARSPTTRSGSTSPHARSATTARRRSSSTSCGSRRPRSAGTGSPSSSNGRHS